MRVRAPLLCLYTAPTTIHIHGTQRQKGRGLVFCERLPLSIGMDAERALNGWTLLRADATCRRIPVPQVGLGSDIAWSRIA